MAGPVSVRDGRASDRPGIVDLLERSWGSTTVVSRGRVSDASTLDAKLALALRFYQRRGMRLSAIYPDSIDRARRTKPSIPLLGHFGIEIHDELELELRLGEETT